MSRLIEYQVNEKQQQDLVELKTKTLQKPAGRVRPPRIRKKDPNHIPRPVNSFLAYRTEMQAIIRKHCPLANHREISKIVAKWWHEATGEEKQVFKDKAEVAKYVHAQMYPDYKFNPKKKRSNTIKKNSKRSDRLDEDEEEHTKLERSRASKSTFKISIFEGDEEKFLPNQYYSCAYQTNDSVLEQDDGKIPDYLSQEIYPPFKHTILDTSANDERYVRMGGLYQDYVLMNEPSYCYDAPMISLYDLTPVTQPLLTPEPEYTYANFASSSISPYTLQAENCWYDHQFRYY